MNDAELAEYLGITKAKERDAIMAKITPEQRATYEAMKTAEEDIMLWQQGVGPKPKGVIICRCSEHDASAKHD